MKKKRGTAKQEMAQEQDPAGFHWKFFLALVRHDNVLGTECGPAQSTIKLEKIPMNRSAQRPGEVLANASHAQLAEAEKSGN
jgi:hypothetical protein